MSGQSIADALYGLSGEPSPATPHSDLLLAYQLPHTLFERPCSHKYTHTYLGMNRDCPELRSLLSALAARIDATSGKLDSQEIGNAL